VYEFIVLVRRPKGTPIAYGPMYFHTAGTVARTITSDSIEVECVPLQPAVNAVLDWHAAELARNDEGAAK
jgi:hypothetical protein